MSSHAPSASNTRSALPCSEMPEPSTLGSGFASKTSTSTPALASWMAVASAATPLPAMATLFTAVMSEPLCSGFGFGLSEDGDGVERRADRPRDGERRRGEQEVVAAELGADMAEFVEVPHLADREAEVRDHDLVQRLEGGHVELVGPHLEAPRVGRDRGDLGAVQPSRGGQRQSGGRPPGIVAPAVAASAGELPGAHEHDVAATDRHALRGGR